MVYNIGVILDLYVIDAVLRVLLFQVFIVTVPIKQIFNKSHDAILEDHVQ
jgi:hypothetical protein